MLKIGCASAHPDDASFLFSEATRQWLHRNPQWEISQLPDPFDASSVDVLLLPADDLNKHLSVLDLPARTWILLSSKRADAYRAWQFGAAYFLLRPLAIQQLETAIQRASLIHYSKQGKLPPLRGKTLELQLTKGRRLSVRTEDILYLEAQGELTQVYLTNSGQERITAIRNLGYWEQQLDTGNFIRSHKKFLVNVARVTNIHSAELQLGTHRLPVAKRRQKEVSAIISEHQKLRENPVNTLLRPESGPVVKIF